jgi:hypothetical protein
VTWIPPIVLILLILLLSILWRSRCRECGGFFTYAVREPSPRELRVNRHRSIWGVKYERCQRCGLKTQWVPVSEADPNTGIWTMPPLCDLCDDRGTVDGIGGRVAECECEWKAEGRLAKR